MAKFIYKAKKGPQEIIEGTMEAGTRDEAVDKLSRLGYMPIQISESVTGPAKKVVPFVLRVFGKVRSRDLTIMTAQLASLVKAKVRLLEAIDILSEQTESASLKKVICYIKEELKEGKGLSEALAGYPNIFPPLYINMVRSGESGGVMEESLMRLADFREKEEEIRAKISSALAYPLFIVIVGIITVIVLLVFAIPRLTSLFSDMGQTLPLPTRILISLSEQARNYWYVFAVAAILFIAVGKKIIGKKKAVVDKIKLKLPLLGKITKKVELARFSRSLAVLLANGIPVLQAIEIAALSLNNEIFKRELEKIHKDVVNGAGLSQSMKKSDWFPAFMTNMVAVGEKGGSLESALGEVAGFQEREVDKITKIMTSLLEPIIILIMGLVIGFIVLAMLLPIFEINLAM